MRIIQETGSVTIYQIEGRFPKTASKPYKLKWCQRNVQPSMFGEKHPPHNANWRKVAPFFTEYRANGECWQKTGQEGFLNKSTAIAAFAKLMQSSYTSENVDRWRLVERTVDVKVRVMLEGDCPL